MRCPLTANIPLVALMALAVGCKQSPFLAARPGGVPAAQPGYTAEMQDLSRRASALDADNRDLHTELARSRQEARVLRDEVGLLREQLLEKTTDLRELLAAKQDSDQRVEAIEASTRFRGGATITANNSLRDDLPLVEVPGLDARRDGDLIRIEIPADRLFRKGTDQLLPTAQQWLDKVATVIGDSYPKQMIGLEGHTDSVPLGATTSHQLAAAQAVAVCDALIRRNRIPSRQLFTVGLGSNRPRVSNATPAGRARNRRLEVVVYPESITPD